MARLKPDKILKMVKEKGFEEAWSKSACLLPKRRKVRRIAKGKAHPVFDLVQKFRQLFINMGFSEVINPIIVEEEDVYKQYGPEAAIILDRCFYLATLPRPEIGLGRGKREMIASLGISLTDEKVRNLKAILRNYKKGVISSDDFTEKVADALEVDDEKATFVIGRVFPEFVKLKPSPTKLTLRSHLTSAWFKTLQALQHRLELPIKLFSVDVKFRREQQEDPTHLRSSITASCVMMDEYVTAEDGKSILTELLKELGLKELRFVKKGITSRYYAPGTEYEAYVYFPFMKDWIEVANFGMYSPIALARYGLEFPVLNIGVGVERVAMILHEETDMRRLVYPHFYAEWVLSDEEVARMIEVNEVPKSAEGKDLLSRLVNTALSNADMLGPCEVKVFEGKFLGRDIEVSLYESDVGAKLLGPAALNEVYVCDGNVLAIPPVGLEEETLVAEARKKGVRTGIRFLDAIASLAVSRIEKAMKKKQKALDIRVKIAKRPSDVNIKIKEVAQRYITGRKKEIIVRGPVFIGIRARID